MKFGSWQAYFLIIFYCPLSRYLTPQKQCYFACYSILASNPSSFFGSDVSDEISGHFTLGMSMDIFTE